MKAFRAALIAMGFLVAVPVSGMAQSTLGEAALNGRPVILKDDFTWEYAPIAPSDESTNNLAGCDTINERFVLCGRDLGWQPSMKMSPDAVGSFRLDDRNYAMVIQESLGSDDGMSLDYMQGAVIYTAAVAAGVAETDVPVYTNQDKKFVGLAARTLIYGATFDGLAFTYHNTMFVDERESYQFLTFGVGGAPTETSKAVHEAFLSAVREQK